MGCGFEICFNLVFLYNGKLLIKFFKVLNPKKSRYGLSQALGPYNYDKRTAVPETNFNDFLRGGLRRLYLGLTT